MINKKQYRIKFQRFDYAHGNVITDWISEDYEYYYEAFGRFVLMTENQDVIHILLIHIFHGEEEIMFAYSTCWGGKINIGESEMEVYRN